MDDIQGVFVSEGRAAQDCLVYYRMISFDSNGKVETTLLKATNAESLRSWPLPGEPEVYLTDMAKGDYSIQKGFLTLGIWQRSWSFYQENGYSVGGQALTDKGWWNYVGYYYGDYLVFDESSTGWGLGSLQIADEYLYRRLK